MQWSFSVHIFAINLIRVAFIKQQLYDFVETCVNEIEFGFKFEFNKCNRNEYFFIGNWPNSTEIFENRNFNLRLILNFKINEIFHP